MRPISKKLKARKESAAALEYFIVAFQKNLRSTLPSDERHGFMAATRSAFAPHKGFSRAVLRLAPHISALYPAHSIEENAHLFCAIVSDGARDGDKWRSRGNFWVQCGDFEYEQFFEILKRAGK